MNYCIITFRSVTPAQRAESLLRRKGFSCSVQRTPRWMEEKGCGYSLRLRLKDAQQCVQLLRAGGISYQKVYLQRDSGTVEELEYDLS